MNQQHCRAKPHEGFAFHIGGERRRYAEIVQKQEMLTNESHRNCKSHDDIEGNVGDINVGVFWR